MKLTSRDIRLIRSEMRLGYAMPLLLLAFCVLFNVAYILIVKGAVNYLLIAGVDLGVLLLCGILFFAINNKPLKDLRYGEKKAVVRKVSDKMAVDSHEAGSGLPYIPVLGDACPKLWKKEVDRTKLFYFVIEGYRYMVDKDTFDHVTVGGDVEMYYTLSNKLLGFGIPGAK